MSFVKPLTPIPGCVLITKPGYEHTVTHIHTVPDEYTIIEFKISFFQELVEQYRSLKFFTDNDLHSTLVKTSTETEFLHFTIMRLILTKSGGKLEIDNLVMEVIDKVLGSITNYTPDHTIDTRLKKKSPDYD